MMFTTFILNTLLALALLTFEVLGTPTPILDKESLLLYRPLPVSRSESTIALTSVGDAEPAIAVRGKLGTLATAGNIRTQCIPVDPWDWLRADVFSIRMIISRMKDKPKSRVRIPHHVCPRVECFHGAGLYLDYDLEGDLGALVQYAQILYDNCKVDNSAGGEVYDDGGYSVLIRGGETCPGLRENLGESGSVVAEAAITVREKSDTLTTGWSGADDVEIAGIIEIMHRFGGRVRIPSHVCPRVECLNGAGLYVCNKLDYDLVGDLSGLIPYAQSIYQTCMVNDKAGGEVHDDGGYSVVIRGGETCPGWVEQVVTRSGGVTEAEAALVGREELGTLSPALTKSAALTPIPSKSATPVPCSDIICISEMHPVYNSTSGLCQCEWINGFEEPIPLKSINPRSFSALDARAKAGRGIQCLPHLDWPYAYEAEARRIINFLSGVTDKCHFPAQTCPRVACYKGTALFVCNKLNYELEGDCSSIVSYVDDLISSCNTPNHYIGGEVHDSAGYSVIVRGGDSCNELQWNFDFRGTAQSTVARDTVAENESKSIAEAVEAGLISISEPAPTLDPFAKPKSAGTDGTRVSEWDGYRFDCWPHGSLNWKPATAFCLGRVYWGFYYADHKFRVEAWSGYCPRLGCYGDAGLYLCNKNNHAIEGDMSLLNHYILEIWQHCPGDPDPSPPLEDHGAGGELYDDPSGISVIVRGEEKCSDKRFTTKYGA